jgi:5'-nucleotidase (lipoprotein e(P4) family)
MRPTPFLSLLAAACVAGCASVAPATGTSAAPKPASTPSAAQATEPSPPADDTFNATVWFQTAIERELVSREVYRVAAERLSAALADRTWDALPKSDRGDADVRRLPPAIIVDVDETVLDNSPEQVRQIRAGHGFDPALFDAWVDEGRAKALAGAREFLQAAAARGVNVFYVSNRNASQRAVTAANLRAQGFPIADDTQFLGLGMDVPGCATKGSDKSCRRQLVGRRHRVLMLFGDQLGDFVQPAANTPEGRRAAVAPYLGWIGQRWWVLPNPMYGGWESALSGPDPAASATAKRAARAAALDAAETTAP